MVSRLLDITAICAFVALFTVVVALVAKEPTVYVGKIEQTFVPVEFPPAIWR